MGGTCQYVYLRWAGMPDTGAESGFTKQGPQKETEQTHSMEMPLMRKPTVQTISFQRHKHTHRYGNPINILPHPDQQEPTILNAQPSAALNANGGSKHFVCRVHYDYFLNRLKGNDKTHDHGESIGAATSQAPPEVCVVSPLNVCVYFLQLTGCRQRLSPSTNHRKAETATGICIKRSQNYSLCLESVPILLQNRLG